ncbi:Tautomerase enzyme [Andreprevotia lacus DSM 23236]|jgi:phenylpyruvate tautomerase PptA (4-oxalocrotonate tautomerase family)|uniref:Tautomerase enzyme n=1 Tax=Andreprevotia lacus DSM 23236 TaxID=1121001 RepID=A0A1W1X6J3_9NEIS|nr:tautomerase family protein [Andreprevotia lacus]SMC19091.1 Tautomerase enzyme [Andreprevotia lacus DSM 23236]
MPFSRISLRHGKSADYLRALSDSLQRALVDTFDVPEDDRFQIIHQLAEHELIFDRHYRGGPRSDDYVLFDITTGKTRSNAQKQAFYLRLTALLAESPGIRPQDVMIVVSNSHGDDWSFANGEPAAPAA